MYNTIKSIFCQALFLYPSAHTFTHTFIYLCSFTSIRQFIYKFANPSIHPFFISLLPRFITSIYESSITSQRHTNSINSSIHQLLPTCRFTPLFIPFIQSIHQFIQSIHQFIHLYHSSSFYLYLLSHHCYLYI